MPEDHDVFEPHFPEGLESGKTYRTPCDDKARNGGSWLQVLIHENGDVFLQMQEWEDFPDGQPNPFPMIRKRSGFGGGTHDRTRQALLWLAEAIRLDMEEEAPAS